jgi:hypothetical protein
MMYKVKKIWRREAYYKRTKSYEMHSLQRKRRNKSQKT